MGIKISAARAYQEQEKAKEKNLRWNSKKSNTEWALGA
jgi:hypothetical protein